MLFRSICLAYLLCNFATVAQGESRRAAEMAECGYLLGLAVEQLHAQSEEAEELEVVVGEVIDYANLYFSLIGREGPSGGQGLSLSMYNELVEVGKRKFDQRVTGVSSKTTVKLANRILTMCRGDLRLLGLKLRHG